MASQSSSPSGDTQSRKSRSSRTNSRSTSSRPRSNNQKKQASLFAAIIAGLYLFLTNHYSGRIILVCLISALVIVVEALVFAAKTQLFFRIVGIEILFALATGWVIYMVKGRQQT